MEQEGGKSVRSTKMTLPAQRRVARYVQRCGRRNVRLTSGPSIRAFNLRRAAAPLEHEVPNRKLCIPWSDQLILKTEVWQQHQALKAGKVQRHGKLYQ